MFSFTKENEDDFQVCSIGRKDPNEYFDKNGNVTAVKNGRKKVKSNHIFYTENDSDSDTDYESDSDDEIKEQRTEVYDKRNVCFPMPRKDIREILFVAGASGCGKSYFSAEYAKRYHKLYPTRAIIFLSKKGEDKAFDKLEFVHRVELNNDLFDEQGVPMEVFEESLVIFDDCHTFKGKLAKNISGLQADLMDLGRSYKADLIITNHLLSDYKKTRNAHNEMTSLVVFPRGSSDYQLDYIFNRQYGFDKETKQKIKALKKKSRWIKIDRYPQIVTHEKGCFLV